MHVCIDNWYIQCNYIAHLTLVVIGIRLLAVLPHSGWRGDIPVSEEY